MSNFSHYMKIVQNEQNENGSAKWLSAFDKNSKSMARKIIRIANNDDERPMWEKDFKMTFKNIPEPSKVITPQDIQWAKNALSQTLKNLESQKRNPDDALYDFLEDLPEGLY